MGAGLGPHGGLPGGPSQPRSPGHPSPGSATWASGGAVTTAVLSLVGLSLGRVPPSEMLPLP